MRSASSCWFLFLCLLLTPQPHLAVAEQQRQQQLEHVAKETAHVDEDNTCTIYMAPSSLKNVNGFGLYTVKDMPQNTNLLQAPDGPSIPVMDFYMNHDEDQYGHDWIGLFNNYWWGRGVWDQMLWEGDVVVDYQIMFGALPNHHCILHSVDYRNPKNKPLDDHAGRDKDQKDKLHPGAGAFSYYKGKDFFVHRNLEAGEELFLNYGKCEEDPPSESSTGDWRDAVLKPKHIHAASEIVEKTWLQLQDYETTRDAAELNHEDVDHFVTDVKNAALELSEMTASILPSSYRDLQAIANKTSSFDEKELALFLAREFGTTKRSVDWIKENGFCMDNIIPGQSTILHAGQGAMAQRDLQQGEMVVPVPTLHILNKDVLNLYPTQGGTTAQLLLNYCLGHNESSLLLCPLTNAILINHCSNRTGDCGSDGPNAEYRWSSGWDPKSDQWREMTLEEIAEQPTRGLALEVVATRDIKQGEEIFVDYGVAWEEAWKAHVADWDPPAPESSLSVAELNERGGPIVEELVSGDLREQVEHPTIFTGCRYWRSRYDEQQRMADSTWQSRQDADILNRYATHTGNFFRVPNEAPELDGTYWPCSVIRSESQDHSTYTVRIHQTPFDRVTGWGDRDLPRFITKYPRSSIRYFNEIYTSDIHVQGVFRHSIHIRDDIFPEQWKNRKQG